MGHSVFLSYSRADFETAEAIVEGLERRDIPCWYAPRNITPGTTWSEAIVRAIEATSVLVVLLTPDANESRQVLREVQQAAERNLPIVAFRAADVLPSGALSYYLSTEHWLDATSSPPDEHVTQLATAVATLEQVSTVENATATEGTEAPETAARTLTVEVMRLAQHLGRSDIESRLQGALERLEHPSTMLCVVGEYKQGKSMLVNALLNENLCPVDDDLASVAVTLLRYRIDPGAEIIRIESGEQVVERVGLDEVAAYASEQHNPGNWKNVELVKLDIPNPVLAAGISIVDTPGVGALRTASVASTLAFLAGADGLVFVTDASAELTKPELDFLVAAAGECPDVLVVMTKTDMYPDWRDVVTLNRKHLLDAGLSAEIIPVSADLHRRASDSNDLSLDDESAIPILLDALRERFVSPSKALLAERTVAEVQAATDQLGSPLRAELSALDDPSVDSTARAAIAKAEVQRRHLDEQSSRWPSMLTDGLADVEATAGERIQVDLQRIWTEADARIAQSDPAGDWTELRDSVQTAVAVSGQAMFNELANGVGRLANRIYAQITERREDVLGVAPPADLAVDRLGAASDTAVPDSRSGRRIVALSALATVEGSLVLLGALGALASMTVVLPLSITLGAAFGARQIRQERQHRLEANRAHARRCVETYIEHARGQLTGLVRRTLEERRRALTNYLAQEVRQLEVTCTATLTSLRTAAEATNDTRAARARTVREELDQLEALAQRAGLWSPHKSAVE